MAALLVRATDHRDLHRTRAMKALFQLLVAVTALYMLTFLTGLVLHAAVQLFMDGWNYASW